MGIPGLFELIRDFDKSIPIVQLAEEHHERYGKPLRIAVDEADWRFNNLTKEQIVNIRNTSHQAFQGQEKNMFTRLCPLLQLNIQFIFVFDGPGRPWKRGKRGQGQIDYRARDLLKEMLRCLGIPSHEAPGEAEAECARLQILGFVDAVWSQDSDCLMFGCTLWLRDNRVAKVKNSTDRSKENTMKDKKSARIVRAHDLKTNLQLDREALVLFAMLVGGDYDTKGLPGCGSNMAMKVIKKGLGSSLSMCRNQSDCDRWSLQLGDFLRTSNGRGIAVPSGFPDFKTLTKYTSPKVSSDDTLKNSARLNLDYARPINELKLLEITSSRFDFWGVTYLRWVGPVLLARFLSTRDPTLPPEVVHGIVLKKKRTKKTDADLTLRAYERKLSFCPFALTTLRREDFEGERLGYWNGDKTPFNPDHRIEDCEMPEYWLRKVLPADVLDPPPREPKSKRKKPIDTPGPSDTCAESKRKRKDSIGTATVEPLLGGTVAATIPYVVQSADLCVTPSRKRQQRIPASQIKDIIELSESEDELRLPPSRFALPSSAPAAVSHDFDFDSLYASQDELDLAPIVGFGKQQAVNTPSRVNAHQTGMPFGADETEDRDLQMALRLSMEEFRATSSPPNLPNPIVYQTPSTSSISRKRTKEGPNSTTSSQVGSDRVTAQQATKASEQASIPAIVTGLVSAPGYMAPENMSRPVSESLATKTVLSTSCKIDDIRAARVRHFQQAAASATTINKSTPTIPLVKTSEDTHSRFCVPEGTNFVDLTED